MDKKPRWRGRLCVCQKCGMEFFTRKSRKETPKSCSLKCTQGDLPKWRQCSECHALIGYGTKKSAQILGCVNHTTIYHYWKSKGIESQRITHGGWKNYFKKKGNGKWWGSNKEANQWMSEYNPTFPDWSQIWRNETASRKSIARYRSMNEQERREWNKKVWASKDKKRAKAYLRGWKRERAKSDPAWKIAQQIRSRLSSIMKGANMGGMRKFIGCDIDQLRRHFESKFKRGMTWENYGTKWHVYHIIPVSKFDHSDRNQLLQCWHWSNLEPLEARANLAKSDKLTNPQLNLLIDCHA